MSALPSQTGAAALQVSVESKASRQLRILLAVGKSPSPCGKVLWTDEEHACLLQPVMGRDADGLTGCMRCKSLLLSVYCAIPWSHINDTVIALFCTAKRVEPLKSACHRQWDEVTQYTKNGKCLAVAKQLCYAVG